MFFKNKTDAIDMSPPTPVYYIHYVSVGGDTLLKIDLDTSHGWFNRFVPIIPGIGTRIKSKQLNGTVTNVTIDYDTSECMLGEFVRIEIDTDEL